MRKFYRSTTERRIAGVFGALGEMFNIDPNILRIIGFIGLFMSGIFPFVVVYVIAWIILPEGSYSDFNTENM